MNRDVTLGFSMYVFLSRSNFFCPPLWPVCARKSAPSVFCVGIDFFAMLRGIIFVCDCPSFGFALKWGVLISGCSNLFIRFVVSPYLPVGFGISRRAVGHSGREGSTSCAFPLFFPVSSVVSSFSGILLFQCSS